MWSFLKPKHGLTFDEKRLCLMSLPLTVSSVILYTPMLKFRLAASSPENRNVSQQGTEIKKKKNEGNGFNECGTEIFLGNCVQFFFQEFRKFQVLCACIGKFTALHVDFFLSKLIIKEKVLSIATIFFSIEKSKMWKYFKQQNAKLVIMLKMGKLYRKTFLS